MQIELLADHQDVIPQLARWFYAEWAYLNPNKTVTDVEDALRLRLNTDKIPLVLVAFDDDDVIGTVSLKTHDMDIQTNLSPWVSSVYVKETMRGHGIGMQLVYAIESKAMTLGIPRLYLYTATAEGFYVRLGWNVIERTKYQGHQVSIMEKELCFTENL